jgi:hypothetical protein
MSTTLDPTSPRQERRRGARARRRSRIRRWIDFLRRTSVCSVCNAPHRPGDELGQITFHHRPGAGVKRFRIASAGHHTRNAVRIELRKVSALCWGCHRDLHAGRIAPAPGLLAPVVVPSLVGDPPPVKRAEGPGRMPILGSPMP